MDLKKLFAFLSEFTRNTDGAFTVIVMDDEQMEQPRQHQVRPRQVMALLGSTVLLASLLVIALIVLTPIKEFIPGYGTAELRSEARLNSLRLAALQDSLEVQERYLGQLRHLVMGDIDSAFVSTGLDADSALAADLPPRNPYASPTENWTDHAQPAVSMASVPGPTVRPVGYAPSAKYLSSIQFPALPPATGFLSRGFDARSGHFAVDIAVDEGTIVRSIGDGYVILADWTQEGGYAIAVQHADGFVSVFKHNRRLLKRVGDRVRNREALAETGNSGEVTTGPHLHVELWQNGLAQDPQHYMVGL